MDTMRLKTKPLTTMVISLSRKIIITPPIAWDITKNLCPTNQPLCAVAPQVDVISVNGKSSGDIIISRNGFIKLTFTTKVDDNQEPITGFKVDWGDGETTSIMGAELRDRPRPENAFTLYHLYDYGDLQQKDKSTTNIKPSVWVKDNWGWYSYSLGTPRWNIEPKSSDMKKFSGTIAVTP